MVNIEQVIIWGGIGYSILMLISYVYALYLGWRQSKVLDEMRELNKHVKEIKKVITKWS